MQKNVAFAFFPVLLNSSNTSKLEGRRVHKQKRIFNMKIYACGIPDTIKSDEKLRIRQPNAGWRFEIFRVFSNSIKKCLDGEVFLLKVDEGEKLVWGRLWGLSKFILRFNWIKIWLEVQLSLVSLY